MSSKALIIPAAGAGTRMEKDTPKPFLLLDNEAVLLHSLRPFLGLDGLQQIVIVTAKASLDRARALVDKAFAADVSARFDYVEGGGERQHSIRNALAKVDAVDLVLVHDAVRPFVQLPEVQDCCEEAQRAGAAILGVPAKDTIKKVRDDGMVDQTLDRRMLWQVQTPQVFRTEVLKEAYAEAGRKGHIGTDDASLVEWLGRPVKVVQGRRENIKLTYPSDMAYAEFLLRNVS